MKRTAAEASTFPEAIWRAWWEREEAKRDGRPRLIFGGFDGKTVVYHAVWFHQVSVRVGLPIYRPGEFTIEQPGPPRAGDPLVLPGQAKLPGI